MSHGGGKRILPIDATRGLVMLFSCLAHYAWWIHARYGDLSATLLGIGMVATPTFLFVSGAMVGMLSATPGERDLKSQLFNRGLFLLTVGHLLIALTEAHLNGGLGKTIWGVNVVDEIGLCTLVAAFLLPRLASFDFCVRLARLAALVLLAAWLLNLWWLPSDQLTLKVDELLVGGPVSGVHFAAHSPIVQHIAIYVLGLPLGHVFAGFARQQVPAAVVASRLQRLGAWLLGSALLLRALRYLIDLAGSLPSPAVDLTLRVTEKIPPSPAYLLFYGGCGLLLVGTLFRLSALPRARVQGMLEWLAVIGRASLFVFILQYFLYWTLPDLLNIHPNALSPVLFVGNVLLMRYVAGLWVALRGNRWLTFGIKLDGVPSHRG
ncbi:MAG TPA: hypothetical protein VM146_09990 [Steroidobacteraceae bacterium]|nr:hypothetical protein [Steroidobacteraceae bacterium]